MSHVLPSDCLSEERMGAPRAAPHVPTPPAAIWWGVDDGEDVDNSEGREGGRGKRAESGNGASGQPEEKSKAAGKAKARKEWTGYLTGEQGEARYVEVAMRRYPDLEAPAKWELALSCRAAAGLAATAAWTRACKARMMSGGRRGTERTDYRAAPATRSR
ncbi:hypothetical protein CSOJ01_10537 [Colletotrichum sojae]|uniref:Uncharacterized protein n=1 Tax=Colletotrichum sojae TaxID=2175907 RepID=A0A8H6J053_9PEZI|nr:hypothetical protein CSOJ01_10537 [Colletotrichum sojae]